MLFFLDIYEYSKSTKTSTGIICTKSKTVLAFGGEGRRRGGDGIGVGFSCICCFVF